MKCQICSYESKGKDFANHVKREHSLSSKEYTVKYLYSGTQPMCYNCGSETRYVAFEFKKYCKNCSRVASRLGGKKGGKASAWNKGLTKETDSRVLKLSEKLTGEKNPFWGRRHSDKTRKRISQTKLLNRLDISSRIDERQGEFELKTSLDDYYSRQKQYLEFQCTQCGNTCQKTLQSFERGSLCPTCYPVSRSQFELEINDYIESLGFKTLTSDRSIISPKELDIVIPDKRVCIEANGLYWHSELNKQDKRFHLNKTIDCLEKDYKLIHIFSDEWEYKKDICKSMISHRLNCINFKIFARKCEVREIGKQEEREFFKKSHISGFTNSRKCWGLIHNNNIVAALSIRIPRQKKYKGMIEIARFACLPNHHVAGGLSKLLKHVKSYCRENNFNSLMTYADRRFGEGNGYASVGFDYIGNTGVDYFYTDGQIRVDRFGVRAQKGLSERDVAKSKGLYKVWGCGSNIFKLNL